MNRLLLLLALTSLLTGCRSDQPSPANALIGTWQLTTYCKPTSPAACTPVTIPTDKNVFVTFGSNGNFNETYQNTRPADYAFMGSGGTYQIEGKNLRIVTPYMSSLNGQLVKVVSLSADRLVLNPYGSGEYNFVKR